MSLNIPQSFFSDIQGRDTGLVPIIKIGSIYISTNSMTYDTEPVLPLLTSNPSLKESIDIEKRNYKISNISITINNYPYEGQRFSERITDSLINTPVELYWISPSTTTFEDALMIYKGQVRRYDHDDTNCKITIEDKSQATLHTDLPTAELDLSADVPDKYRGAKIPIVIGHVDRSPCVVDTGKIIKIDSQDISGLVNDTNTAFGDTVSPLLINVDDSYLPVLEAIEEDLTEGQYEINDGDFDVGIDGTTYTVAVGDIQWEQPSAEGTVNTTSPNIIIKSTLLRQNSILQCKAYHKASSVEYIDNDTNFEENLLPDNVMSGLSDNSNDIIAFSDDATFSYAAESGFYPYMATLAKLNIYTDLAIGDIATYTKENADDKIAKHTLGIAINGVLLPIPKLASGNPDRIYYYNDLTTTQGGIGTRYRIDGMEFDDGIHTPPEGTRYDLSGLIGFPEEPLDNDFNIYSPNGDIIVTHSTSQSVGTNTGSTIGLFFFDWCGMGSSVNQGKYMIYFRVHHVFTTPAGETNDLVYSLSVDADFKEIDIKTLVDVENIFSKDFYANVNGRAMDGTDSPTAPSAIKHILNTELGQNVTAEGSGYADWQYAFTVDKKIGSKRLLENIASASPYIPYYNNRGDFHFTEIPKDGGTVLEGNTIKDEDCISFSFSKTRIEDVYTKVVFKYNWDYAKEEFSDSVEADISYMTALEGYNFDYYGLPDPEVESDFTVTHPESTLTIDDDRGKYIRNHGTAQDFAEWYLLWSCNQHLKLKVKLPLKYMNLEIGDFVDFNVNLGGVKPYGKSYSKDGADSINNQQTYSTFLITETEKNLQYVEIFCTQMHNLSSDALIKYGCMDENACPDSYDPDANAPDEENPCYYPHPDCGCEFGANPSYDDNEIFGSCGCFEEGVEVQTDLGCGCGEPAKTGCDNECGSTLENDCSGVCGGSLVVDDCGVCGGDNDCDCPGYEAGTTKDCLGVCGGTAVFDECGVCGGSGIPDGECDCNGNVDVGCGCGNSAPSGCDNECGSTAVEDCAGVCGGDAVQYECCCGTYNECGTYENYTDVVNACDCNGNVPDCSGICGGTCPEGQLCYGCDNQNSVYCTGTCNGEENVGFEQPCYACVPYCCRDARVRTDLCPSQGYEEYICAAYPVRCDNGELGDPSEYGVWIDEVDSDELRNYCTNNDACDDSTTEDPLYPWLLKSPDAGGSCSGYQDYWWVTRIGLTLTDGSNYFIPALNNMEWVVGDSSGLDDVGMREIYWGNQFYLPTTGKLHISLDAHYGQFPPLEFKIEIKAKQGILENGIINWAYGSNSNWDYEAEQTIDVVEGDYDDGVDIEMNLPEGLVQTIMENTITSEGQPSGDSAYWQFHIIISKRAASGGVFEQVASFGGMPSSFTEGRLYFIYNVCAAEDGYLHTLGDMNNDGWWNVLDIVALANCVLADNCVDDWALMCPGDINGDGNPNILDIVTLSGCVLTNSCEQQFGGD